MGALPAGWRKHPQKRGLARIAPAGEDEHQQEHGRQPDQAGCRAGDEQGEDEQADQAEDSRRSRPAQRSSGHPIGTFTTRVYCSNSETLSTISMSQVPPGLSTAELST